MAKKNFDAFINAAGKKPKPTPEEVEAMAKQLHQPAAVPPAPVEPPAEKPQVKAAKADAPPIAKEKAATAKAANTPPPAKQDRNAKNADAPREKVRITIDLAKGLYKRMKLAVVQNETEISAYVRQLIEDDLARK